jgi:hypothetical protein
MSTIQTITKKADGTTEEGPIEEMSERPISRRQFEGAQRNMRKGETYDGDGEVLRRHNQPMKPMLMKTREPGLSDRQQRPMTDLRDRDD